jgi:hypothetical protein
VPPAICGEWSWLFAPERHSRIDSRRSSRWNVARGERDEREDEARAAERQWIETTDTEEQTFEQGCPSTRNRDPAGDADCRENEPLAQHETQDASLVRTERHADADLARPSADGEGSDAVNSDRRKQQADESETSGNRYGNALRNESDGHDVTQGECLRHGQVGIQCREGARVLVESHSQGRAS